MARKVRDDDGVGSSRQIKSPAAKTFNVFNIIFLTLLGLLCLYPFWYEICISFSSNDAVNAKSVYFLPVDFSLEAFKYVLERGPFWKSLGYTVLRVCLTLPISMVVMCLAAYPLSKSNLVFRARTFYVWFFFLTMLFNGGMIPTYLLVTGLGLKNSIWALVLPTCVNVFNMLLLLSFFRNIPDGLEDAARIDGAGHLRTLFQIFVPISKPVLATVALFTRVNNWNAWFDGMIYMQSEKYPLQTYLRTIIFNFDFQSLTMEERIRLAQMNQKSLKAAQMVIGAIPILMVYPFLQKYFVSGITLGSVKG
ncbi:MAG: carbohydrate ABC transporter permease [Lachnospiraceae bacterium]|nr:carbohydrate ABC transporter permease [Lachnospiraceae bacterium]